MELAPFPVMVYSIGMRELAPFPFLVYTIGCRIIRLEMRNHYCRSVCPSDLSAPASDGLAVCGLRDRSDEHKGSLS